MNDQDDKNITESQKNPQNTTQVGDISKGGKNPPAVRPPYLTPVTPPEPPPSK
jgi:hypothetical protein